MNLLDPSLLLLIQGREPNVCKRLENLNSEKSPGVEIIYPVVLRNLTHMHSSTVYQNERKKIEKESGYAVYVLLPKKDER